MLSQLSQTSAEPASLKEQYLSCFSAVSVSTDALLVLIKKLRRLGTTRKTLIQWAVEAGYSESHARNLLSRLLRQAGGRLRSPGAGRKTPQEALALLAMARDKYGDRATRFLLAAYRAAKVQSSNREQGSVTVLRVA